MRQAPVFAAMVVTAAPALASIVVDRFDSGGVALVGVTASSANTQTGLTDVPGGVRDVLVAAGGQPIDFVIDTSLGVATLVKPAPSAPAIVGLFYSLRPAELLNLNPIDAGSVSVKLDFNRVSAPMLATILFTDLDTGTGARGEVSIAAGSSPFIAELFYTQFDLFGSFDFTSIDQIGIVLGQPTSDLTGASDFELNRIRLAPSPGAAMVAVAGGVVLGRRRR